MCRPLRCLAFTVPRCVLCPYLHQGDPTRPPAMVDQAVRHRHTGRLCLAHPLAFYPALISRIYHRLLLLSRVSLRLRPAVCTCVSTCCCAQSASQCRALALLRNQNYGALTLQTGCALHLACAPLRATALLLYAIARLFEELPRRQTWISMTGPLELTAYVSFASRLPLLAARTEPFLT